MLITDLLLTIYFWSVTAISLLFTYLLLLILYPFVSQKTFSRLYELIPGYIILYSMIIPGFWNLTIKDYRKDTSWTNKRYIIVANHLSFIDSLVACVFPLKKKFMIGKIFTKIPVFGWLSLSSGHIPVDKDDPSTTIDAVKRSVKTMSDGSSFMLYPEGKRSVTGELLEFKTGAYRISQETGVPILPICLRNTEKGMRIGGIVSFANMEIIIGEPFQVESGWDNVNNCINKTKQFILDNRVEKKWISDRVIFTE